MSHLESTFESPIGNIYYQQWSPAQDIKAVIMLIHGLAEHSSRYQHFADYFTQLGYAVCAIDLPGHGKSAGTPGYIDKFADFTRTVTRFLDLIKTQHADLPIYLVGHSMGGLISTTILLDHQAEISGCILSGPAISSPIQPPAFQLYIIKLLSMLVPKLGVLALDSAGVSRDPKVVEKYINDPLNYTGKLSARIVSELFKGMANIRTRANEITTPILILHGGEDSMAAPEGSQLLFDRCQSNNKNLHIYPDLYHEIFNEPEQEAIFGEIANWLQAVATPD
ncbi:MAG: lysophospholipase [Pseudomonadales bacterium]